MHRYTVAGLGKPIERAGVAAKIGSKVRMHTAKTVVASALRSSAGANKHGVFGIYRPSPHAGQAGGGLPQCPDLISS